MHPSRVLSAVIYFTQAFFSEQSTLYEQVSGESACKLAVIKDDESLCPLVRGQPEFDFHTSQHNTSSGRQSTTCIWTDNQEKQYCVFTDPHFDHGKGMAVITTPERARHIFKSIASLSGHSSFLSTPLFRTRASGSKGRGIFATKHIPAGSLITQEPPIIFLDRNWMVDISSEEDRSAVLALAVEKLPASTRQTVHELYAGPYEEALKQRLWTNGYGVSGGPTLNWPGLESESDLGMIAVHANISKINHSCRSNAASQWDWDMLAHRLYAVRDIAADEEITISYINPIQTLQARQEYAKSVLGFVCACSQCKAPRKFNDLSDDRINEILLLEDHLENREIAPAEPTAMAELLVSLYKQEGLDSYICKAYAIAAREWNGAGYEYQARLWAYQSLKAGLIAGYGTGMEEYVNDMEALLDGARKHWSWRYRVHS
ncbi:Putative SET domain-containing protein [Colletotrichum destructivum]|uniref:SET domain-containing protein n=1 Tax=Colletotrichum destructivum TaxID=34406 RepID=A0AAX4J585_9PEZI|nr:Putative SET domain-containing protein [Colletotrichum destructivum]